MGYCPCFGWRKGKKLNSNVYTDINRQGKPPEDVPESTSGQSPIPKGDSNKTQIFTYRELAAATKNFRVESFIGQGGFGAVYKGQLESTGQVVAVKKLDTAGLQGEKEFLVEVLMLSLLRHPNLVNLIGYCAEGDQRLLVYEYMPLGSVEDHLHAKEPLDWNKRMMIAAGAAKGLDYLHNQADPPVIYRDLKTSNILLDEGFHPKLSDFGLAKFAPSGDRTHVSTRVMGTHGYCAPEYAITGKLTAKSDIYCFGVVLLELITGLQAHDDSRGHGKEVLVNWARPLLKDPTTCVQLADPRLKGQFKESTLRKALELASMCIREESSTRPPIGDILPAMNYFTSHLYNPNEAPRSHSGSRSHRDEIAKSGGMILEKEGQIREFKVDIKVGSESEISPKETTRMLNKDLDRERAVAEAKMWGETWRGKRLQSAQTSPDGLII